ncbi:hypothetical protein N9174_01755 [bacterium]|nr:hypothetical protein [bacterium]
MHMVFIKGIARAGRGASEFISPGERIAPKTLRIFNKINQQGIDDVSIQWGKSSVDQAPAQPAIFLNSPVTVFAKCKFNQKDDKVTLKGKIDGRDKEWEIDVTDTEHRDLPMPILWARDRIRDLEESNEVFVGRGSRQTERKEARVERVFRWRAWLLASIY